MIRSFFINNFKSLINFSLPPSTDCNTESLPNFICLIGLNGTGKSTLLQAFDFLYYIMSGEITTWLNRREWKARELKFGTPYWASKVIHFKICIEIDSHIIEWSSLFSTNKLRCTHEEIKIDDVPVVLVKENKIKLFFENDSKFEPIKFDYTGSILSRIKEYVSNKREEIKLLIDFVLGIKSIDLLSPHLLKGTAREGDIGLGGERLPSFLKKFSRNDETYLQKLLKNYYPNLINYNIKSQKYGWKRLIASEDYNLTEGHLETDARHINDGMLRILAILALTLSERKFILFDEIENGINPELIGKLLEHLTDLPNKQIIVTTHSPIILNFLPEDIARKSVYLLYKIKGETQAINFFSLPETAYKLDLLGPGEVFMDSSLLDITKRLENEKQ